MWQCLVSSNFQFTFIIFLPQAKRITDIQQVAVIRSTSDHKTEKQIPTQLKAFSFNSFSHAFVVVVGRLSNYTITIKCSGNLFSEETQACVFEAETFEWKNVLLPVNDHQK